MAFLIWFCNTILDVEVFCNMCDKITEFMMANWYSDTIKKI